MSLMSTENKKQINGLLRDTIIPALLEDFEWQDQEELDSAVKYLCQQITVETSTVLISDEE